MTFLILSLVYLISVAILYYVLIQCEDPNNRLRDQDLSIKIMIYIFTFCPVINTLFLIIMSIVSGIMEISFYIKRLKKRKQFKEERKEKIKLGIIKITKNDPYGEEDWD